MVTVGGLLTGLTRKLSRKGDPYAVGTLEDLDGSIEVVFWPSTYAAVADRLAEDRPLLIQGRLELRDEAYLLKAVDVTVPELGEADSVPLWLSLTERQCTPSRVDRLKAILATHPGPTPVHLHLSSADRMLEMRLPDRYRVSTSPALSGDLKELLGPGCLT